MDHSPDSRPSQLSRFAFDWIDVLVLVGVAYGVALAMMLVGYRPPSLAVVTPFAAPIAWGLLGLRAKVWPRKARLVQKRLSFSGIIATGLMVGGFFIGAFGAFLLTTLPSLPRPVNELEIRERATRMAGMMTPFAIIEGAKPAPEQPPTDAAGFDELLKELEKPPGKEAVEKIAADLRAEESIQNLKEFERSRRHAKKFSALTGLFAIVLLAVGAWLDGKRKVVV